MSGPHSIATIQRTGQLTIGYLGGYKAEKRLRLNIVNRRKVMKQLQGALGTGRGGLLTTKPPTLRVSTARPLPGSAHRQKFSAKEICTHPLTSSSAGLRSCIWVSGGACILSWSDSMPHKPRSLEGSAHSSTATKDDVARAIELALH